MVTSILLGVRRDFVAGADAGAAGMPAAGFGKGWHLVSGQLWKS